MEGDSSSLLERLNSAWNHWLANFNQSLASLQFYRAGSQQDPGKHESAGVSLIVLPETQDLAFIQWTIPGKAGRVADYDHHNYLKCIVPVGKKRVPLDLSNPTILIAATGVKVLRQKRRVREMVHSDPNHIPDALVRFMNMWRSADGIHRGEETILVADSTCFVCNAADIQVEGDDCVPRLCPMCLLCSHTRCCDRLLQHAADDASSASLPSLPSLPPGEPLFPVSLWDGERPVRPVGFFLWVIL